VEDRLDVLWAIAMKLALDISITSGQDGAADPAAQDLIRNYRKRGYQLVIIEAE